MTGRTDISFPPVQDEDLDIIYDELLQGYGAVTFEAFINLLVRTFAHVINCGLYIFRRST